MEFISKLIVVVVVVMVVVVVLSSNLYAFHKQRNC